MLKNILMGVLGAIIVVAIAVSAYTAFASPSTSASSNLSAGNGNSGGNGQGNNGQGGNNGNGTGTSVLNIPAAELDSNETAALLFMLEEEKLARDVYNFLFTIWGQPTFQNIAASEQAHMDEIKLLVERYGLADPTLAAGQFTDASLQALYTQLTTQGSLSIGEALKVGAVIEEIDIRDLQTRLARTDNADIQLVFNNLMNGSYNHLKAFSSTLLTQTGEIHQPQYLTPEEYQAILAGQTGNSNQGGAGGQGNNWQGSNETGGQTVTNGIPQANIAGATSIHGSVVSFDLNGLTITTDDGQTLSIQLGNSRYSQSIGFAPPAGEGLTVYGFPGDQGLFSAITITLDSTGQVYTFRSETGQPLWAGGNGKGNGGNH